MRRNIHKRLEVLERSSAAFLQPQEYDATGGSAVQAVRDILEAHGVEQQPKESLAETFARFLGISTQELDARLREGAYPR
jgi:hypothetical protein